MKKVILGPIFGVLLTAGLLFAAGCGGGSSPALYIALGDSIAEGQGATDEARLGYVGLFYDHYQEVHKGPERLTTYGQDGETSSSISDNQLANAFEVIGDDETDVEVVTLTIGGNDFLPLVSQEPCSSDPTGLNCRMVVATALTTFGVNFQAILQELTAALADDPGEEQLLVTTYYNPYRGTGSPYTAPTNGVLLGLDGVIDCAANAADPTKAGLNDLIVCIGASFGAKPVDLYPLFDGKALTLTHISEGDIHPNDQGHQVIANAVIRAYTSD